MMLLIAMAITVAYVASLATSLGWFDLEFWWELAALITIMLLGHWQEMKALGQAQSALVGARRAAARRSRARRRRRHRHHRAGRRSCAVGDVVLVRSGQPCPGRRRDRRRRSRARRVDDHGRVAAGCQGPSAIAVVAGTVATDSAIRVRVDAVGDDTALAGIQRLVAEAQASHSRAQALADRFAALLFYVATGTAVVTFAVWALLGRRSTTRSCAP